MNIFYPYSEFLPGDVARALQTVNTALALAQSGAKVELFASLKKDDADILRMYGLSPNPNLSFIHGTNLRRFCLLGLRISWGGVFYKSCIRYLMKKKDKNFFIYTRHLKLASILLKRFPHIPLIYEAHEIFSMKRHLLFHMEKFVLNNSRGLVFISHSLMEKTKEFFPLNVPAAVIPDGVNPQIMEEAKNRKIPGDVVYVGQLYPWKGVGTLIASMKYLSGVRLTIVGGGSGKEKKGIANLVDTLRLRDRVNLTGFLPYSGALRHMAGAKILALPLEDEPISRYFTSPLKLFEYMACRVPIVASDLPTIREILSEDSAILVKPGDEKALADSIDKLLKDKFLAQSLSDKAYAISHEYSWIKRAERIMQFLNLWYGILKRNSNHCPQDAPRGCPQDVPRDCPQDVLLD